MVVKLRSHHFVVTDIAPVARTVINTFEKRWAQMGLVKEGRRYVRAQIKLFAAVTADRREFRFHINTLEEFRKLLAHHRIPDDQIQWETTPFRTPVAAVLPVFPEWTDLDHQVPAITYGTRPDGPRSRFLEMQTGRGKSYCAMRITAERGRRAVLSIRASYIIKWMADFNKTYQLPPTAYLIVEGTKALQTLMEMARLGELEASIIVISNKTLQLWHSLYLEIGDRTFEMGYQCRPDEFYEYIGAGIRLIDEVHQDFHMHFIHDLFTHVEFSLAMSATMIADDDFVTSMYEVAYPKHERYAGDPYQKYITALAVIYGLKEPRRARFMQLGRQSYSHVVFEQYMMKNPKILAGFFDIIIRCINAFHFDATYKKGHRCMLYSATTEFAGLLHQRLAYMYPELLVLRYCAGLKDPYDNLLTADLSSTTLQSSGAAVDVPRLKTVIMGVALASSQGNVQGLGRLRDPRVKDPNDNTETQFLYLVCEDIPKQVGYHEEKRILLRGKALRFKTVTTGIKL